jgi:hypothetical protein
VIRGIMNERVYEFRVYPVLDVTSCGTACDGIYDAWLGCGVNIGGSIAWLNISVWWVYMISWVALAFACLALKS